MVTLVNDTIHLHNLYSYIVEENYFVCHALEVFEEVWPAYSQRLDYLQCYLYVFILSSSLILVM